MTARRTVPLNNLDLILVLLIAILVVTAIKVPTTADAQVDLDAQFLIEFEWDEASCSDIDLWFQSPRGERVWFGSKQVSIYSLERDDLGCRNDYVDAPDGSREVIRINREMLTMRGSVAGEYRVNAHVYHWSDDHPITATLRIVKLTPYRVVVERQIPLSMSGQEVIGAAFRLDDLGEVLGVGYDFVPLTRNSVGRPQ